MEFANTSPAQRAAATRRIKRRATQWRELTRPAPVDVAEKLQNHIDQASRATWSRPPLSAEAVLWTQFDYLCRCAGYLVSKRSRGPGNIGALRLARHGTAALVKALSTRTIDPQPTTVQAIEPGDMIEHDGTLSRVTDRLRKSDGYTFRLESGAAILSSDRDTLPALRPADFDEWTKARKVADDAEYERSYAAYRAGLDAFEGVYVPAFEAKDWPTVRGAVRDLRSVMDSIKGFGSARATVIERIALLRKLPPLPTKGSWGSARRGFLAHVKAEAIILQRLDWLRSLPGYQPEDRRAVVKVRTRAGQTISVCGDSLRGQRWGDYVERVNAAGQKTSRTGSIACWAIVEILPERAKRPAAAPLLEMAA